MMLFVLLVFGLISVIGSILSFALSPAVLFAAATVFFAIIFSGILEGVRVFNLSDEDYANEDFSL